MSNRPEILFPLFADLPVLDGIGPKTAQNFAKIGITRLRDLLFVLPNRVISRKVTQSVLYADPATVATVEVLVGLHRPNAVKGRQYRVSVEDALTSFQLVFFHARAEWLRDQVPTGQRRVVSGKLDLFEGVVQMVHPDYILRPGFATNLMPQN